jgi:hypothetical protein
MQAMPELCVELCGIEMLNAIARQLHCNENPIYVFLFWEFCGLSPNFNIRVSVSDFYIPPGLAHIFPASRIGRSIVGIYKLLTDT